MAVDRRDQRRRISVPASSGVSNVSASSYGRRRQGAGAAPERCGRAGYPPAAGRHRTIHCRNIAASISVSRQHCFGDVRPDTRQRSQRGVTDQAKGGGRQDDDVIQPCGRLVSDADIARRWWIERICRSNADRRFFGRGSRNRSITRQHSVDDRRRIRSDVQPPMAARRSATPGRRQSPPRRNP